MRYIGCNSFICADLQAHIKAELDVRDEALDAFQLRVQQFQRNFQAKASRVMSLQIILGFVSGSSSTDSIVL